MKIKYLLLSTLLVFAIFTSAYGFKAGPAEFADGHKVFGADLKLRGAGLKRFLTIQVVAVGLYLPENIKSSDVLIDCAKRLEVVYLQNIPKDELQRATIKGIKLNVSKEEFVALQAKMKAINDTYIDVRKGDRIVINYVPQEGLKVIVNGKESGVVGGADIAKAFFAIWVGEYPVDAHMKNILLGKGGSNE